MKWLQNLLGPRVESDDRPDLDPDLEELSRKSDETLRKVKVETSKKSRTGLLQELEALERRHKH